MVCVLIEEGEPCREAAISGDYKSGNKARCREISEAQK
jgi:hypothetical protein